MAMSPRAVFMTSDSNLVVQPFSLISISILFLIVSRTDVERNVQGGTRA